jgi:hypothetical protein
LGSERRDTLDRVKRKNSHMKTLELTLKNRNIHTFRNLRKEIQVSNFQ